MGIGHKMRLKRLIQPLLFAVVVCTLAAVAVALLCPSAAMGILMVLFGGPASDDELIKGQFDCTLPVFSEIVIVDRSGDPTDRDNPRRLVVEVAIDGYPDPIGCQAELVYFHSDPSYVSLYWSEQECEQQDLLVRAAQRQLEDDHAGAPLPSRPGVVAQLLQVWIDRGWIVLADIKHPEMREMVSGALEGR